MWPELTGITVRAECGGRITHRCHKKEFLLRFAQGRLWWLHWLFEGKQRFVKCILNYVVISNHIHLLVRDSQKGEVIPQSMQLSLEGWARSITRERIGRARFGKIVTMQPPWIQDLI